MNSARSNIRRSKRIQVDPGKPRVQSAARTVQIILAVARSRDGLRATEISQSLKLPRQVTYHLLHTLNATGIISKREQNRYRLGLAAMAIVDGFRRQLAPPAHLAPVIRSLAERCGETAYASGWIDGEIAVLATARGHLPVHAAEVPHGFYKHAHARASGKLLLALAETAECDSFLDGHPLVRLTPNTITSKPQLLTELKRIRARRYSVDEEEFALGVCCLAVPVEDAGGQIVLSISVPTSRFHDNLHRYLADLRSAAKLDAVAA